jgi:hypothetical protein
MLKKLTSILLVAVVFCTLTSAQEKFDKSGGFARVKALGMNQFVLDPENIKYNPAYIGKYNNFLWGDIGDNSGPSFGDGSSEQFVGVNFQVFKGFNLGLILSRTDTRAQYISISQIDPGGLIPTISPAITLPPVENNFEVMGSFDLDKLTVGLGLALVGATDESKPATGGSTLTNVSQLGINGGIVFDLSEKINFDASFALIMPGGTYEPPAPGKKEEASQTILAINARSYIGMTQKMTLVPVIDFSAISGTYNDGTTDFDLPSVTQLGIGVGMQYKVGNFMFIGGPSLMVSSTTYAALKTSSGTQTDPEMTDSYTYFPNWNLGAEWLATDWLICRMGYYSMTGLFTDETKATATTKNERIRTVNTQGKFTLGLGFRFGGFGLDATVNSDVLRQGLGNIGGGPTFAHISASYGF